MTKRVLISGIVKFIISLSDGNNRIILASDVNGHAVDKKLVKELKRMSIIGTFLKKINFASLELHELGSVLIDRVWLMGSIIPSAVSILPYKFHIGNHRVILTDFELDQVVERRA